MIPDDAPRPRRNRKTFVSNPRCKDGSTPRQIEDLLVSLNHELRTPLTAIRAFSSILLEEPDMERAQRQRFLAVVVEETERLTSAVNRLLSD